MKQTEPGLLFLSVLAIRNITMIKLQSCERSREGEVKKKFESKTKLGVMVFFLCKLKDELPRELLAIGLANQNYDVLMVWYAEWIWIFEKSRRS